jgi:folylpolyglutamate synthase/dihydropteroate synthase
MADSLSKISDRIFISGLRTERSADPGALKEIFEKRFRDVVMCESISSAMDIAVGSRSNGNNILVTGSFYTAEEALIWLKKTYPGYWTYSQRNMTEEHTPEGRRKV